MSRRRRNLKGGSGSIFSEWMRIEPQWPFGRRGGRSRLHIGEKVTKDEVPEQLTFQVVLLGAIACVAAKSRVDVVGRSDCKKAAAVEEFKSPREKKGWRRTKFRPLLIVESSSSYVFSPPERGRIGPERHSALHLLVPVKMLEEGKTFVAFSHHHRCDYSCSVVRFRCTRPESTGKSR